MNNRIDQVKSLFAQPERYLKHNFNIRIRAEVVAGFVGDTVGESILDIGCGNGAISLPLLREHNGSHLKPGGSVLVQNSNVQHPVGCLFNLNLILRNAVLRNPYPLNRLRGAKLVEMFSNHGLELSAIYRYNLPFPGMAKVFTNDSLYERIMKSLRNSYT